MKIPKKDAERFEFFIDLQGKCNNTREDRRKMYNLWRSFFLFGGGPEENSLLVNKIYPHIDQLAGLMYSSETTRFSIDVPPSVSDLMKEKIPPLMQKLNETWHLSNSDLVFSQALLWSFVYGTMFVKIRIGLGGQVEPYVVEPHDVGVLREDICGLWKQEAFTHNYYVTQSQLETQLKEIEHPRLSQIIDRVNSQPRPSQTEQSAVLDRIVTSASSPNVVGNINFDLSGQNRYKPKVVEPLVQMSELYVWNDETSDYQVVTIAEPGVVVFDRSLEKMFIKNESPIVQVCPTPAHDFFWGYSEVDKLIPLQKMRNERFEQVQHMMNLQARPPKFGSGFQGDVAEIMDTMDSPSGLVVGDMPGAKLETVSPTIPDDLFQEIRALDAMFEEMSGITNVMQGKGEAGVRSQGHASNLARLGSSRAKKRALVIEDQLEKIATLYMQLMQAYDTDRMRDNQGIEFIAEQFTDNFIVKVDAHSNSPIFQEDQRALAFELFKAKCIDRESLLDLLDVPMKELLKGRLKSKIEPQEAAAKQAEAQAAAQGAKVHQLKKGAK